MIAEAALDGEKLQASEYELPAATTNVIPSATPRATASLIATSIPELVPRLMLATAGTPATWCSIIQLIPATMPAVDPEPLQSRTRTGMIVA